MDYINEIFTDFIELHGDRNFGDEKSIVGGIGLLEIGSKKSISVTIIGEQKGKNIKYMFLYDKKSPKNIII